MKKIILLIYLLVSIATPAYCFSGNACDDASNQGCYLMEGATSSDETDESANTSDDLTSEGTDPTQSTTKKFGTYSRLFDDGGNDHLGIATDETIKNFTSADLTICAYIQPDADTGDNFTIVSKERNEVSSQDIQYRLRMLDGGTIGWTVGSSTEAVSTTDVGTGTWVHVCGVKSGTSCSIWIDGTNEATQTDCPSTVPSTGSNFTIGYVPTTLDEFSGYIDEVGVWTRVLSESEIQDLRDNGLEGAGAGGATFIPKVMFISKKGKKYETRNKRF